MSITKERSRTFQDEVRTEIFCTHFIILGERLRSSALKYGAFIEKICPVDDGKSLSHIVVGDDDSEPTSISPLFCEPYVQQLCRMLVRMGAKIEAFSRPSVFSDKQIPLEADFVDEVGALAEFCLIYLHQLFTVAAGREIYSY